MLMNFENVVNGIIAMSMLSLNFISLEYIVSSLQILLSL